MPASQNCRPHLALGHPLYLVHFVLVSGKMMLRPLGSEYAGGARERRPPPCAPQLGSGAPSSGAPSRSEREEESTRRARGAALPPPPRAPHTGANARRSRRVATHGVWGFVSRQEGCELRPGFVGACAGQAARTFHTNIPPHRVVARGSFAFHPRWNVRRLRPNAVDHRPGPRLFPPRVQLGLRERAAWGSNYDLAPRH